MGSTTAVNDTSHQPSGWFRAYVLALMVAAGMMPVSTVHPSLFSSPERAALNYIQGTFASSSRFGQGEWGHLTHYIRFIVDECHADGRCVLSFYVPDLPHPPGDWLDDRRLLSDVFSVLAGNGDLVVHEVSVEYSLEPTVWFGYRRGTIPRGLRELVTDIYGGAATPDASYLVQHAWFMGFIRYADGMLPRLIMTMAFIVVLLVVGLSDRHKPMLVCSVLFVMLSIYAYWMPEIRSDFLVPEENIIHLHPSDPALAGSGIILSR